MPDCRYDTFGNGTSTFGVPKKYLNRFGFIKYSHDGHLYWLKKEHGLLPVEFTSPTQFLAIDCEMVGIGPLDKSALARVSIVNEFGYCIYNQFVKPREKVTDYRTEFSGVREADLIRAPSTNIVIEKVKKVVRRKCLVGHAIHHDLEVLELNDHPPTMIRDTAVYFKKFLTKNLSLKNLTARYLRTQIQNGEHSSIDDAQATMKLYLKFRKRFEESISKTLPCGHEQEEIVTFAGSQISCQVQISGCTNQHDIPCFQRSKMTCNNPVTRELGCGHKRVTTCSKHIPDIKCLSRVKKLLPCGHFAMGPCYFEESKMICPVLVFGCKDHERFACYKKSEIGCNNLVTRRHPCGHEMEVACSKPLPDIKCRLPVLKSFPCGHSKTFSCHLSRSPADDKCMIQQLLPCGHEYTYPIYCHQSVPRSDARKYKPCKVFVSVTLPVCKHKVLMKCYQDKSFGPISCMSECKKKLRCGHFCKLLCHVKNNPNNHEECNLCVRKCWNSCPKGHPCTEDHKKDQTKCSVRSKCIVKFTDMLKCRHFRHIPCHEYATSLAAKNKPCEMCTLRSVDQLTLKMFENEDKVDISSC